MKDALALRTELDTTLDHIDAAFTKTRANSGRHQILTFPDMHKLSEGLLLSVWTHWEGFCRDLMVYDLGTDTGGQLKSEIKKFRTKGAPFRLAEKILGPPDSNRFVEWNDYPSVKTRADTFLSAGHRFVSLNALENDLTTIKRVRNAVAHKSDRAWASFRSLVQAAPFSLAPNQMRGLTAGRFVSSHQWAGNFFLHTAVAKIKQCAVTLVP
jgi:hypothetical protein